MRAVSKKLAVARRQYAKQWAAFFAEPRGCEFPLGCDRLATQVHHRRGRIGALLTDERYWSALCGPCHRWVTEHPARAYDLGISERRIGQAS